MSTGERFIVVEHEQQWLLIDTAGLPHTFNVGNKEFNGYLVGEYKTAAGAKKYATILNGFEQNRKKGLGE